MRTLTNVALIFDLLGTCYFDFFICNVIIELLLALKLLLMMSSNRWWILLTCLIAAYYTWVLLELYLWNLLQHLLWLLLTTNWTWEVFRSSLIPVLHDLRNFLPHTVWIVNVAWNLNIVRFIILFFSSTKTYKVILVIFVTSCIAITSVWLVRRTHSTCHTASSCTDDPKLQNIFLLFRGFLFDYNFLFSHTLDCH